MSSLHGLISEALDGDQAPTYLKGKERGKLGNTFPHFDLVHNTSPHLALLLSPPSPHLRVQKTAGAFLFRAPSTVKRPLSPASGLPTDHPLVCWSSAMRENGKERVTTFLIVDSCLYYHSDWLKAQLCHLGLVALTHYCNNWQFSSPSLPTEKSSWQIAFLLQIKL